MRLKCLKIPLKHILNDHVDYGPLYEVINRTNLITFNVYYFLRIYILDLFNNNKEIPKIDDNFIMAVFKTLTEKTQGPKNKDTELLDKLSKFYLDNLKDIKIYKSKNLSYILNQEAKIIEINYKNNITLNFIKYLRQYINEHFKNDYKKDFCKYENKKEIFDEKLYKKILNQIKKDIIEDTYLSEQKYHEWINNIKNKILPKKQNKCDLYKDIQLNYHNYLKYMLIMNKDLETNNYKLFQPLPIRKSITDSHITINTHALIDIMIKNTFINYYQEINKSELLKYVSIYQDNIWEKFFNIDNNKKIKVKNHSFNYEIKTDGISVSLNYIHNDDISKKQKIVKLRANKSKESKKEYKDKSFDEIKQLKLEKENNKKIAEIDKYNKYKEQNKGNKKEKLVENYSYIENALKLKDFRNQFKEKLEKLNKIKNNYDKNKLTRNEIAEKIKEQIKNQNMEEENIIYVDPGKRTLLCMMSENGIYYNYNTKRRLRETKRLKYNKLIINKSKKTILEGKTLKEYENELTKYNAKTQNIEEFKKYMNAKIKLKLLISKTKEGKQYNDYLKKHLLKKHINTIRHEDKIINEIKRIYGKKSIIIIGDWNESNKINYISTPTTALKNKLSEHFKVYLIDEFNTSKINYKTEEENGNLSLKIKTNKGYKEKEFHSILTYKMSKSNEKEHLCCINRDKNSVNNMRKIVKHIIENGKRPEKYIRKIKETNEPLLVKSLDVPVLRIEVKSSKRKNNKNGYLVGLKNQKAEIKTVNKKSKLNAN